MKTVRDEMKPVGDDSKAVRDEMKPVGDDSKAVRDEMKTGGGMMKNDSHWGSVFARAARTSAMPLLAASVAFASVVLAPASAEAKREFPAELAKAADMPCVPQCTVCHVVNPGEAGTATKPFAIAMIRYNVLSDGPRKAFEALKADNKPEYQAMVQAIEDGLDPNYPKQLACGPSYGCGAHVAKKPPRDYWGIAWVAGALSAYALARRFKARVTPRL